MTRHDAVMRIAYLSQCKKWKHERIGEEIGLTRQEVRAIFLGQAEIDEESANRLDAVARREGFYERMGLNELQITP